MCKCLQLYCLVPTPFLTFVFSTAFKFVRNLKLFLCLENTTKQGAHWSLKLKLYYPCQQRATRVYTESFLLNRRCKCRQGSRYLIFYKVKPVLVGLGNSTVHIFTVNIWFQDKMELVILTCYAQWLYCFSTICCHCRKKCNLTSSCDVLTWQVTKCVCIVKISKCSQ